jgi:hypothetical protein
MPAPAIHSPPTRAFGGAVCQSTIGLPVAAAGSPGAEGVATPRLQPGLRGWAGLSRRRSDAKPGSDCQAPNRPVHFPTPMPAPRPPIRERSCWPQHRRPFPRGHSQRCDAAMMYRGPSPPSRESPPPDHMSVETLQTMAGKRAVAYSRRSGVDHRALIIGVNHYCEVVLRSAAFASYGPARNWSGVGCGNHVASYSRDSNVTGDDH